MQSEYREATHAVNFLGNPEHTTDFRALELYARRALFDFDFSERELRVLNTVIDLSFGQGELSAWIGEQTDLEVMTGIHKSRIGETIAALKLSRVLSVKRSEDGSQRAKRYSILLDPAGWNVPHRIKDGAARRKALATKNRLRRANRAFSSQMELIPEDPGLDDLIADDARASALRNAGGKLPDRLLPVADPATESSRNGYFAHGQEFLQQSKPPAAARPTVTVQERHRPTVYSGVESPMRVKTAAKYKPDEDLLRRFEEAIGPTWKGQKNFGAMWRTMLSNSRVANQAGYLALEDLANSRTKHTNVGGWLRQRFIAHQAILLEASGERQNI